MTSIYIFCLLAGYCCFQKSFSSVSWCFKQPLWNEDEINQLKATVFERATAQRMLQLKGCYSSKDATKDITSCVFKCHFRPFVLVVVIWRVVIIQLVLLYALKCHDGNSFSWRTPFVFVLHEVERISVLKLKGSVAAVATFCSVVLLYDRYPTHRGHCWDLRRRGRMQTLCNIKAHWTSSEALFMFVTLIPLYRA